MKEVYTTPNGEWKIVEQSDPEWQSVFGESLKYFNAVRVTDNFLIFSGKDLESVFKWLYKRMIISKDEMNYQIALRETSDETSTI